MEAIIRDFVKCGRFRGAVLSVFATYQELQTLRTILKFALRLRCSSPRLFVGRSLCDSKEKARSVRMSKCGEVNRRSVPSFELPVFDQKSREIFSALK